MYHYTECGLVNVWLANGYNEKKTAYGKAVSIDDADGLHCVLAMAVVNKQGRVTGKELRFLRVLLEMSQAGLAELLGATEQSVSLWERTGRVPKPIDAMVRMLVLERLKKDTSHVRRVIDRINAAEGLTRRRIVASEKRNKWTSTIEAESVEEAVTA